MDFANWTIWLPTLTLVLARLGGLLVAAPAFSSGVLTIRLRCMLAIAIGLGVVSRAACTHGAVPAALPAGASALLGALAGEVLVGLAIGYAGRLAIAGIELGAFHVSQQMGVSLAEMFDPQVDDSFDAVRRLMVMLATVIFLAVGGHRALISAVMGTFQALPPMGLLSGSALSVFVALLAASFALALKVAAPVLIAMLLAAVAMGFLQKSMPQFNILSVGLPVRAMVALMLLAASLAAVQPLMDGYLTEALGRVGELAGRAGGSGQ